MSSRSKSDITGTAAGTSARSRNDGILIEQLVRAHPEPIRRTMPATPAGRNRPPQAVAVTTAASPRPGCRAMVRPARRRACKVEPIPRPREGYVYETLRLLALSSSQPIVQSQAGSRRRQPMRPARDRRGTSVGLPRFPVPLARLTTKTTGNSRPFEACTVIRLTASSASIVAFDSSRRPPRRDGPPRGRASHTRGSAGAEAAPGASSSSLAPA